MNRSGLVVSLGVKFSDAESITVELTVTGNIDAVLLTVFADEGARPEIA